MARKGQSRRQKRLSVGTVRHLRRKEAVWTVRQKPGSHARKVSVPVSFVVRDMLGLGKTLREAKRILNTGSILVDNVPRKSHQFGVGLFDTINVAPTKKYYRMLLDSKGRMILFEIGEKMIGWKPAKVIRKKIVKGNTHMVQTHDGKTYTNAPADVHVGGSVLVSTDGKITESLSLAKGNSVFIIGGAHVGEIALINDVVSGAMRRPKLVSLSEGTEKFQTIATNVMVIDADTANWLRKGTTPEGGASA